MKNTRVWSFGIGAALALLQGCYNDGEMCEIGVFVACVGDDGCSGLQACGEDAKLGVCVCDDKPGAGSTGPVTTSAETTSAETSAETTSAAAEATGSSPAGETSSSSASTASDATTGGGSTGELAESTGTSTETTGSSESMSEPGPDCLAKCAEEGAACGPIDCDGAYHNCGDCAPGTQCQGNTCVPPCEKRDVMFVNAALPRDLCNVFKTAYMTTEMTIESAELGLAKKIIEPGKPVQDGITYGAEGVVKVTCKRVIKGFCDGWDYESGQGEDTFYSKVFEEDEYIKADTCEPTIVVVGCDLE